MKNGVAKRLLQRAASAAGRAIAGTVLLSLLGASAVRGDAGPIATGSLRIQGNRLTIYADAQTNDADQTINVGERARVRTCFGGSDAPCGTLFPGDPRVAGLVVRGDLRGPELPQSIGVETVPGGSFVLPGFQQEGDYRLENVRLVEEASGQVLATAEPSFATLHVRQILLASATVRTLSLEELRQRGITFSAENFQAFNFAVGFAFGDQIVTIELPIVYSGFGTVQPLDKPRVMLDGLPENLAHVVKRWQPPVIVPFKLEQAETEGLRAREEEDEDLNLPLFGAIVLPGTVSYLNQFFEAKLIVANGAPSGSGAFLGQLSGTLRLPGGNVLRVVQSDPPVAPGTAVPVLGVNGSRALAPGEQGSAAWTVEGLVAGSYTLQLDITGDLERAGRDPFPLLSRIQAAIEVVDARFNLSFSHPDVVREGEEYTLYVTVTNLSRAAQNLVTVDLDEAHLTGAHRADPNDNLRRTIQTLQPGGSETLEYRLVAELDGKVVATTFQSTSSAGQGTIRLRTGVGELGIPLSPATLVLPRFSERLKTPYLGSDELHRAHNRFLGLAYSLAVAPAALTPSGLPRVIKTDVERRAIDFAQAGMRTYLHEPLLESIEVLTLDYLGNRSPLVEIDELRRSTGKGLALGTELGKVIRGEQASRHLGAEALFDQFAETTTYTDPYVAALLVPEGNTGALELTVQGAFDGVFGNLGGAAGLTGSGAPVRTLPFGEVVPILRLSDGPETVPLALVGHVALDEELVVVIHNPGSQVERGDLLVVVPEADGREDRRLSLPGISVQPGGTVTLRIGGAIANPHLVDDASGAPVGAEPGSRRVARPPFRLIGSVQDFRLKEEGPDPLGNMIRPNRYGNGLIYLFNRPPVKEDAEDAGNYRIRSTFSGLDTAGQPAAGVSDKLGSSAWVQDDGRTVAVRYALPVSALIQPGNGQPLLSHEHLLDVSGLHDGWGESLSGNLPPPGLETVPLHLGGLVTGKVVRGTGEPVAGAKVQLIRPLQWETVTGEVVKLDFLGEMTTGADGVFFFDFIENPSWDKQVLPGFTLRATIPAGADPELQPEEVQEVSSTVRLQNRALRMNIALLGRGTLRGRVVYADDSSPVTTGSVRATSTLFNEEKSVPAKPDGSFTLPGVPVGPITLTARDETGRVVYATVGVAQPGDVVEVNLRMPRVIPGFGTVAGTVLGATSGEPVLGARVTVYTQGAALDSQETDAQGRFRFDRVPEGQVTLQAANWTVSRIPIVTDLILAAGETREVELRLPQGASRTVTGSVFFHDPISNTNVPIQGAVAFIEGPGNFAYTDAAGRYRIEGVPVQGTGEAYSVHAIDFTRKLEGKVGLPPILDVSPDEVAAQSIVLTQMSGGIDGVALDPLGRPLGNAEVVIYPYGTATTQADGSFSFNDLPLATHSVVAHLGDGLTPGKVGYIGDAAGSIVYGGHRPFVTVRMRGAGMVHILTKTATSTGILTPIYYKPTYFSGAEYRIRLKGAYIETSTDPNGNLDLTLPVGPYEIVAYNPFHGLKTLTGVIDYAGQVVNLEVVFEDAATITGTVVGVDGVTPVPGAEVVMEANGLKGQRQIADAQGTFRYELVPKGRVTITATGLAGNVERVGRTLGYVGTAGQTLDVTVQMKAQGTVTGRVMENFNGTVRPLVNAYYALQEDSFPYRRFPEAEGTWLVTDTQGRFSVSHVYAGGVTAIARDSGQVGRMGSVRGDLTFDWQNLQLADIVMTTSVGSLRLAVRNPVSGGPVADAQVRLSNNEATVTDSEGIAFFDALPLGTYSVYAFYAPTGQSGRLSIDLTSPGQQVSRVLYLDQRGDVRGTLWSDAAKTLAVGGGIIRLSGDTAGGRVTALATTSSDAASLGRFEFQGIPEGTFLLEGVHPTTPQRASATASLTATSPIVDINLILEPIGDRFVRLYERLKAGSNAVSLASGVFSTRLTQGGVPPLYDFAQLAPLTGTNVFKFPNVLVSQGGGIAAEELTGERRKSGASFAAFNAAGPVPGSGSQADPYQLTLSPKGVVRVSVRDAQGHPAVGANVTLSTADGAFPSITGADGTVTFAAVPSGALNATASNVSNGTSGYATATLTYDDDLIEITVGLAPAVAAHGTVYQPVPNDLWNGDPSLLTPAPAMIVELRDSKGHSQVVLTDDRGQYRFGGLPTGGYSISARNNNGDQLATGAGSLAGPDGNDNPLPALVLDASPPRLLSIAPPPGFEGVSLSATIELVFSEPLLASVLPANQGNPTNWFSLRAADGAYPAGTWSASLNGAGQQVVRFVPIGLVSTTVYGIQVVGGGGGVRDRMNRPLTASGNIGASFKTADVDGPAVIATNPDLGRPVDPVVPIRFDFSEAVHATDEQLDGDLSGDAAELYWERDVDGPGGAAPEWRRLPITTYLTRSNFSLVVQAVQGVTLAGDTLRRQIKLTGLLDGSNNVMPDYVKVFRIYDAHAPHLDAVPYPAGVSDGQLLQGQRYILTPQLSALDDVSAATPGGDIDRLDYYLQDPTDPAHPVSASFSAKAVPFVYSFVAAYTGDGTAPRPFPVWVQAVDTSTNKSNVVLVNLVVLPNTKPSIESVGLSATAPVPGIPYAGSSLVATVDGIYDLDSSQLTLFAELWKQGGTAPIATASARPLTRPASGWNNLPSQTFPFTLPPATPEGTPIFVRARVIDPNAAVGTQESAAVPVADDAQGAQIDDFSARLAGAPVTNLFIGEDFYLEVRARDVETGIQELTLSLDRADLFPGTLTATKVTGTTDLYRTGTLTVPPGFTTAVPVTGTVHITDFGGNTVERTTVFSVGPERDPTAPVARWQLPWQGALWPAGYTSTVSPSQGAAILVRFYARDTNLDADGNPIPGHLVTVQLRGPVKNATTGAIETAAAWTTATKVVGSDDLAGAVYQGLWRVPNGIPAGTEIPFEARLIDSASTETITRVTMTAVPARRVYEGVLTSAAAGDAMLGAGGNPDGPVFLLDGSTLSLLPQATATDGTRPVRHLPALFVYAGASTDTGSLVVRSSVLTAPEITSYDSAILYQPLELAVDNELGLSVASRIDMTKKGLLGSTSTRSMVLPGETGAAARAGGSHGGEGWSGSPSGGWNTTNLTLPGSLYDSLRDPYLPGGGGGSADANAGGTGGGVIRLLAGTARIRLDGDLVASGGDGSGGASGGGAGGAIRVIAERLEGIGRIQALGGGGTFFNNNGGGGGGRISLRYQEIGPTFDLAAKVDASGGLDDAPVPTRADRRGGAGTIFIEVSDPASGQAAPGRLVVRNPIDPARAGLTPLPGIGSGAIVSLTNLDSTTSKVVLDVPRVRGDATGDRVTLLSADGSSLGSFPIAAQARIADATASGGFRVHLTVAATASDLAPAQAALAAGPLSYRGLSRLASIEAEAAARVVADDDLLLGADPAPLLNDRSAVLLKRGARALLRGEAPTVTFTATPAPGSDLLLGATASVSWTVSDPLGLAQTKTEQTFAPTPVVQNLFDEPLSAASSSATNLPVPLTGAPASVSYTVEARNNAGRVTRTSVAWPVPANQPPAGSVTLAAGTATPLKASYPFTVVVPATDRERLLKVTLTATGPITPSSPQVQTATVSGTSASPTFTINVAANADGSAPVVLQALIEDASGGSFTTPVLSVPVAANGSPSGVVGLAANAPSRITPGQATTILVHAEDADGLTKIDLHVTAPAAVTQPEQSKTLSGNPASNDSTFSLVAATGAAPQTVSVTATITDRFGSAATTAPFTFQIVGDLNNPVATITLSPDRGAGTYRSGEVVHVTASATDNVAVTDLKLVVDGVTTSSTGAPVNYDWTVPALTSATAFTIQATATDGEGNTGSASRTVNAGPVPADLPPVVSFTCPTTGALLPSDYTTALSAAASDDVGITSVRFYLGDATTPFATVTPSGAPPAATTAGASFNLATVTGSTVRFRVEATDTAGQVTSQLIDVSLATVVNLKADGQGTNNYAALTGSLVALRSGTLTIDTPVTFGGLIVLNGALLTHTATPNNTTPKSLQLTVNGPVYVGCGGAIDATGRGYAPGVTYPAHALSNTSGSGGSRIGEGATDGTPWETFGSLYFPRENGSGSFNGRGGGSIRLVAAQGVQIDGVVKANGEAQCRGGGGGSVWLTVGTLSGGGSIEVKGGDASGCSSHSGGGGAIAIEYSSLAAGAPVVGKLRAQGGVTASPAGAGTVYLRSAAQAFGDLVVENGTVSGAPRTVFPALGNGTARAGSGGAVLATGRSKAIPPYFVGHWVEIRSAATGALRGTWRIESIAADGLTVTLAADGATSPAVSAGDAWQGVYRVDSFAIRGTERLVSADPVRVVGQQTVSGSTETDAISADRLVVKAGAMLTQRVTPSSTAAESLAIDVRELVVESGAVIDVTGRGYAPGITYPNHAASNTGGSGGSHIGEGATDGTPWETFGSVYFPRENGSGSFNGRGGGAVRIFASGRAQVDGVIRANGEAQCRGGGGGSVWLRTGALAGVGSIEAKGGNASGCSSHSGGGGAIAVEYTSLEAGATLLSSLQGYGGSTAATGGAGSIYLKSGSAATYGQLIVDNGTVGGHRRTVLPSLGQGTAQAASAGAVLATGRAKVIPPYFVGHWIEVRNGQSGALKGTWRIGSIAADGLTVTLAPNGTETLAVAAGDGWQGVYRFDQETVKGDVQVVSADPIRVAGDQVISGPVETDAISADRLVVKSGATLTQRFTSSATAPESLAIDVRELVVESGGAIDVSSRGYLPGMSYPNHAISNTGGSGGSHIGEGGTDGTPWETFGSVYSPRENGSGSFNGRGGGAVRIFASGRAQVDGVIRANGEAQCRGGGGGSVWLRTGALAGVGSIEAKGGIASGCSSHSGGGGAIAVEYTSLEAGSTLLSNLQAYGGSTSNTGGAGSIYLKGGSAPTYGQLIVDNGTVGGHRRTVLPSLGLGTAQAGSGGAVLVTGRAKPIQPYFVGHWVEIRNGQTGALEGTWRIAEIGLDGQTAILASSSGEPVTVDASDRWQGVYRLDQETVKGDVQVVSADPIRVAGDQMISGPVETDAISADRLVVKAGATLTQRVTPSSTTVESLAIDVRELVVESGGAIDVTGRGYAPGVTYPNHAVSNTGGSGGSHIGEGPSDGTVWETFGSVTSPRENGSGSFNGRGGGAVRIVASERAQLDGAIRANGEAQCRGGGGGSVWLRTGALAGVGTIEAKGGNASGCSSHSGGGGAIAVEYTSLEAGSTLLSNLQAYGGSTSNTGGAGSIYLKGGSAPTYGQLIVDNGTVGGHRRTVLPSLGQGTAQAGSGGAVLVTGRAKAIPAYFVGHWVEIRNGQTGALEGTWKVGSLGTDGLTVNLVANGGEPVTVDAGDAWQGVYRFDQYAVRGDVQMVSADPIRVYSDQIITGTVETDSVYADRLVVKSGATLTQRFTSSASAPESLAIEVRELVVESGGVIDVTGRGYAPGTTYTGHSTSNTSGSGGSHLGEGGTDGTPWQTFGSVTVPRENGSASFNGRGGGAVRIVVGESARIDGTIRANGEAQCRGGAGGSVWLRTASLAGGGAIEAKGGNSVSCSSHSGGGGAIAIEYTSVDPAASLLDHLTSQGGSTFNTGGAGTVYLKGPGSTLGSLAVDNKLVTGSKRTVLPSLGRGIVQPGTAGGTMLTDRAAGIPAYFVGSWVEVEGPDRVVKGIWRIASLSGTTMILEPKATQPFTIAAGDRWRGLYRFDQVTVGSASVLVSTDPIVQLVPPLPAAAIAAGTKVGLKTTDLEALYGNDEAPVWDKSAVTIAVGTLPGSYRITLGANAVADPDGLSEVQLTSGGRSVTAPWTLDGAALLWAGRPGQRLYLVATDAHGRARRSAWLELPPLPAGGWNGLLELAPAANPLAVVGGSDWLAIGDHGVWIYGAAQQPTDSIPPRTPNEETVGLTAGDPLIFAATRERLDLLDRVGHTVEELPMLPGVELLDVAPELAAAPQEAMLLISDQRDPAHPVLRLAEATRGANQPALLSLPSESALPPLREPKLVRTPGRLHLFGLEPDGSGVAYSWPDGTPGEPLTATPEAWDVATGWRSLGSWSEGALLLDGNAVRLLRFGATGWSEAAVIDLGAAATGAAVSGDDLVVALPGEVVVYDLADPALPALVARHPGSSYRQVTPLPGGEVLLWSPRMPVPPLRWNPATAVPGAGFQTVIEGLP